MLSAFLLFLLVTILSDELRYIGNPRTGGIGPAIERPTLLEQLQYNWTMVITPPFCVSGAIMLLLYRRKAGLYLSAVGLGAWIIWSGYTILGPYFENLFRYWNSPWSNHLAGFIGTPILIYLFIVPVIVLGIGWKKVKWSGS